MDDECLVLLVTAGDGVCDSFIAASPLTFIQKYGCICTSVASSCDVILFIRGELEKGFSACLCDERPRRSVI